MQEADCFYKSIKFYILFLLNWKMLTGGREMSFVENLSSLIRINDAKDRQDIKGHRQQKAVT